MVNEETTGSEPQANDPSDDITRAGTCRPYRKKMTKGRRKRILKKRGHKCYICEATDVPLELDHQVPLFLGGPDEDFNIRPLCEACHKRKTVAENRIRGKINRLSGKTRKKKARKLQSRSRWPRGRKIASRGFPKRREE